MNDLITIRRLKKSFNAAELYNELDLDIEAGKITSVFGPNGSGKTTLLDILSGLTPHTGGRYTIQAFSQQDFSYIFQNYRESLLPWKTNYENVAFPLVLRSVQDHIIRDRIDELKVLFQFDCDWDGYPYELSGGQQQILAFLRALITNPKVLFIDEPFSALDYENNLKLRRHIQAYYCAYKPTVVLITHNIEEAVHLSHRVVVFSKKPTKVVASIENRNQFPRPIEFLGSKEFHGLKDQVLKAFRSTIRV